MGCTRARARTHTYIHTRCVPVMGTRARAHTHTETMLVNEQRLPLFVYIPSAASVIKPQTSGVANRDLMTC